MALRSASRQVAQSLRAASTMRGERASPGKSKFRGSKGLQDQLKLKPLSSVVEPRAAVELLLRAMSHVPALSSLGPAEVELLAPHVPVLDFTVGDQISTRGELATWTGLILEGSMATIEKGHETTEHKVGSVIGLEMLFGNEPRKEDIRGQAMGYVAVITMRSVLALCQEAPHLALTLMRTFAAMHLERLAHNPRLHPMLTWNTLAADVADVVYPWCEGYFKPSEFGTEVAKELIDLMHFHKFETDEPILDQYSRDDFVCFVVRGSVQLSVQGVKVSRLSMGTIVWSTRFFSKPLCVYDIYGEHPGLIAGIHFKAIEQLATTNPQLLLALVRMLGVDAAASVSAWRGLHPHAQLEPAPVPKRRFSLAPVAEVFYTAKLRQQELEATATVADAEGAQDEAAEDFTHDRAAPPRRRSMKPLPAQEGDRRDNARLLELVHENRRLEDELWRMRKEKAQLTVELSSERSRNSGLDARLGKLGSNLSGDEQELVRLRETNSELRVQLDDARTSNHYHELQRAETTVAECTTRIHKLQRELADYDVVRSELEQARELIEKMLQERKSELDRAVEAKEQLIEKMEKRFFAERAQWKRERVRLEEEMMEERERQAAVAQEGLQHAAELNASTRLLAEELLVVERENRILSYEMRLVRLAVRALAAGWLVKKGLLKRELEHVCEQRELEFRLNQEKLGKLRRSSEAQMAAAHDELEKLRDQCLGRDQAITALRSEVEVVRAQDASLRAVLHEQKQCVELAHAELPRQHLLSQARQSYVERYAALEGQRVQILKRQLADSHLLVKDMASTIMRNAEVFTRLHLDLLLSRLTICLNRTHYDPRCILPPANSLVLRKECKPTSLPVSGLGSQRPICTSFVFKYELDVHYHLSQVEHAFGGMLRTGESTSPSTRLSPSSRHSSRWPTSESRTVTPSPSGTGTTLPKVPSASRWS